MLNARYSISSWLWVAVSTVTAFVMLLIIQSGTEQGIDEFLAALPFNGIVWTLLLVLAGLTTAVGMAANWQSAVGVGSFISFCLWVFGSISFVAVGSGTTVVVLTAPLMVFFAYLFLGVALRDRPQA
jgi:hypothetical protein